MTETPGLSTEPAAPAYGAGPTAGSALVAEVELRLPADSAYVAVLRSVTAGLAARCDLTLDEIEDLRIAIDEACALLLPLAQPGAFLLTTFELTTGRLTARSQVRTRPSAQLGRDGFGWTVLDALTSQVHVAEAEGELSISLTKERGEIPR